MATQRLCSIPDCSKPVSGRGLCGMHYYHWRKTADPALIKRSTPRGVPMAYLLAHMHDDCPKWPFARTSDGYGEVQHNSRTVYVHRFVCELVHGPSPLPGLDAAHSCGKGHEGCFGARCIEWKTRRDNQLDRISHDTHHRGERHGMSKLTEDDVRKIRSLTTGDHSHSQIASMFNISREAVSAIYRRRSWGWLD
jgi:predicted small metal-binding protein